MCVLIYADDLAAKANIIIDPAEIQAASMDDLDEDDESGAAQVKPLTSVLLYKCAYILEFHVFERVIGSFVSYNGFLELCLSVTVCKEKKALEGVIV